MTLSRHFKTDRRVMSMVSSHAGQHSGYSCRLWTSLICTLLCCGPVLCTGHFSVYWSKCSDNEAFLTVRKITLEQCKTECSVRQKCKGANYWDVGQYCELMSSDGRSRLKHQKACVYIGRDDTTQPPGVCAGANCQVCNKQNDSCDIKECDRLFDSNNTVVFGNIQFVNSKVRVDCKPGYIYSDGTYSKKHMCQSNGEWAPDEAECIPASCQSIAKGNNETGEYEVFDEGSKTVIKIFCDFRADHGYTFISKGSLDDVTNLEKYYTRTDHVMIRHLRDDTSMTQMEGKISVPTIYRNDGNISILLNRYNSGFNSPIGITSKYIYLQLVPDNFIFEVDKKQGYNFESQDVVFRSSDGNANNYLVIHNGQQIQIKLFSCHSNNRDIPCSWIEDAKAVDNGSYLPSNYFYHYSMHMGGSGVLLHGVVTQSRDYVRGVAFGFRFDL